MYRYINGLQKSVIHGGGKNQSQPETNSEELCKGHFRDRRELEVKVRKWSKSREAVNM